MRSELRAEKVAALCRDRGTERAFYPNQWSSYRRSVDPLRVLVIDADFGRSTRILVLVRAIGTFETRTASTAESAVQVAGDFLPNVVLLNTDLPHLAGYQLASALRWRSGLAGMRLIALTSDLAPIDRRRALEAGFEQYLTIPVQLSSLENVLRPGLQGGVHPKRAGIKHRTH